MIKIPVLSPIRFYPDLAFDNNSNFQNPDNRVSTGYNFEGVRPIPYALPIPKQWPDYQPGIDFLVNVVSGSFYADLYDSEDAYYKSLYVNSWEPVGSEIQWRVWLDGESGSGIADGYYTVKLFNTSDDSLLFESEALLIADWFEDMIPFEYWNFENDFGIMWDNGDTMFTARIMAPVRMYDPSPEFEKEVYKNDPGVLTTLRTIAQRVFNFDSLAVPVHVAEVFQLGFGCSELYLNRIHINSEEAPEAGEIEGSNLKQLSGKVTFVDFNSDYMREKVETSLSDENIDWDVDNYATATITGNSIVVNTPSVALFSQVISDGYTHTDEELIVVKIVLTDDAGDSTLPFFKYDEGFVRVKEWGTSWFSFRVNSAAEDKFYIASDVGDKAVFTAVINEYSIS